MFDHVGLDVRDLKKSTEFYTKALAPLGIALFLYKEEWQAAGFRSESSKSSFWLGGGKPTNGEDDVHICFAAKNRAQVRAFYDAAIAAGGRDLGKPGLRDYHEHYYGAFVLDLDGNNIEACCHDPE